MSSVGSPRESFAIQFAISYVLHMVDLKRELAIMRQRRCGEPMGAVTQRLGDSEQFCLLVNTLFHKRPRKDNCSRD